MRRGLKVLKRQALALVEKSPQKNLVLFLDYDGTLTPIRKVPSSAVISRGARALIERAVRAPGLKVCVVTGRSLSNIRGLLDIKGLSYIGNHGLEVRYKGRYWSASSKRAQSALKAALKALKKEVGGLKGLIIEDKGLTFSVHYRGVRPALVPGIRGAVSRLKPRGVRLREGKKVFELRPDIEWDKGRGVLKWLSISNSYGSINFYLGDDITDEDAFGAVNGIGGVTVKVGDGKTLAGYRVRGVREVHSFIKAVVAAVEKTRAKSSKG